MHKRLKLIFVTKSRCLLFPGGFTERARRWLYLHWAGDATSRCQHQQPDMLRGSHTPLNHAKLWCRARGAPKLLVRWMFTLSQDVFGNDLQSSICLALSEVQWNSFSHFPVQRCQVCTSLDCGWYVFCNKCSFLSVRSMKITTVQRFIKDSSSSTTPTKDTPRRPSRLLFWGRLRDALTCRFRSDTHSPLRLSCRSACLVHFRMYQNLSTKISEFLFFAAGLRHSPGHGVWQYNWTHFLGQIGDSNAGRRAAPAQYA